MDVKELMHELAEKIERTANVRAVFGEPVGTGTGLMVIKSGLKLFK